MTVALSRFQREEEYFVGHTGGGARNALTPGYFLSRRWRDENRKEGRQGYCECRTTASARVAHTIFVRSSTAFIAVASFLGLTN